MNRLDTLYDGARGLVSVMGDNVKHAGKWLDTGAKIGALKGGARIATVFARRHPVLLAATAAGAGLLWYAAHRRAKQARNGHDPEAIEGSAKRVDARRLLRGATRSRQANSAST